MNDWLRFLNLIYDIIVYLRNPMPINGHVHLFIALIKPIQLDFTIPNLTLLLSSQSDGSTMSIIVEISLLDGDLHASRYPVQALIKGISQLHRLVV